MLVPGCTSNTSGNSDSIISSEAFEDTDEEMPANMESTGISMRRIDEKTPEIVGKYDITLMSSVIGAYLCQAVMLNALFASIAMISQKIQEILGIDTGALLLGRLAGIITVTLGGCTAYKASEFLLRMLLVRLMAMGIIKRGNELLEVLRDRNNYSVSAPLAAISYIGNSLGKQRAFRYGLNKIALLLAPVSTDIAVKRDVLGTKHTRATVLPTRAHSPTIKELTIISLYCLTAFSLLGGRPHSFTPSDIVHPGAFAVPKLSLLADGYNYADKKQKSIIQQIGHTYGCHTCGYISKSEKYIADHQPPSGVVKRKLNRRVIKFLLDNHIIPLSLIRPNQYFYPHCSNCSALQAKAVRYNRKKVVTHYGVFRPYYLCASSYLIGRSMLDTKWNKFRRRGISGC
ncbi:hypothetical protein BgAZ_201020 [Babesia gibsoni]|uniref:Uncharacterized protein n=1 Tax=Babesia gibsoni TaxID=33632 RepID=A0AAD8LQ56_BABGI|nr:hypothetical protein BgAZ_201020 [Babesia gibsoni]